MLITQRVESYEIILDKQQEYYSLQDIRFLRNRNVHAIAVTFGYKHNAPVMYSYTGKQLCSGNLINSCFITIVDMFGKTILEDYPMQEFYNDKFYIPGFMTKVDLNKSFIRVKNQTQLTAELNTSIILSFFFNDRPLNWKKYFELRSEQVTVLVDDITKTKFFLTDIDSLRGRKLKAIQVDDDLSQLTLDGLTKVSANQFYSSYLVLQFKNSPVIKRIPLYILSYSVNKEENKILFDDLDIDLVHSYIEISHTAFNVLNTAYFFNWYFIE